MLTECRLFLTQAILFLVWLICPRSGRHHIQTAVDFLWEDFIAKELAEARRRQTKELSKRSGVD